MSTEAGERMAGPCVFDGCVATWEHYHGGFPGGYNDPADPEGVPIRFTGPDPDPAAVRDYNGAALTPAPPEPGLPWTERVPCKHGHVNTPCSACGTIVVIR